MKNLIVLHFIKHYYGEIDEDA